MALIKCPECNKEVSDKAEVCPHCGIRLKEDENKPLTNYYRRTANIINRDHRVTNIGGIIIGIVFVIVGIGLFIVSGVSTIKQWDDLVAYCITMGFAFFIIGVFSIIYSAYRLKNY